MRRAGDLLEGRFEDWLAPAAAAPLWLFVHVPKTAGSSLAAELAALLPPYRSIHIDHADRARSAAERYDEATAAFLAEQARAPARSASGHVQFRQVGAILRALPGTRLVTMLREPVARLVSDYLYQRSPMHPLAAEMRARVPDFAAFVELPGQRNRIARHLLPPRLVREGDAAAAADFLLRRYAFVGVQERYGLCFRALTALLCGRPHRPSAEPRRVNEAAAEERAAVREALRAPALRARIAALNGLDLGLHAAVAAGWERIAAPLAARLDAMEREAA